MRGFLYALLLILAGVTVVLFAAGEMQSQSWARDVCSLAAGTCENVLPFLIASLVAAVLCVAAAIAMARSTE
jgi:uncharacterized membrane protein